MPSENKSLACARFVCASISGEQWDGEADLATISCSILHLLMRQDVQR